MMLTVPVWAQSADEKETTESNAVRQDLAGLKYDHSLELQYADQFSVDYYEDGYALITIAGDGQFLLVPEGKEAPEGLDSDIAVIKQPLDNIYLVATSAMDLFCALDGLDSISLSGTNADGWYIDEAKKALEDGSISFAGKYSAPDYELILSKNCDLAIESTMIYHKPEVKEKLEQFGIPVLVEHSSYESHPLGRTEWLKLYGVLLGKEELADKLFQEQVDKLIKKIEVQQNDNTEDIKNALDGMSQDFGQMTKELTGAQQEISEKIHTENVKCYRNIQGLMQEFAEKMEKVDLADESMKSIKHFFGWTIGLLVCNLAALAGVILYFAGVFSF